MTASGSTWNGLKLNPLGRDANDIGTGQGGPGRAEPRSASRYNGARPLQSPVKAPVQRSTTPARPALFALSVLTLINLLNYLDRYVVSGIIPDLKAAPLLLTDGQIGLLTTAFMAVYMIAAPIFGALGDRGKRTTPIAVSRPFCGALPPCCRATSYAHLLGARAIVGTGEAAYVWWRRPCCPIFAAPSAAACCRYSTWPFRSAPPWVISWAA